MSRAKGNPADAAVSVRVVEPIHFPDLSERRALKLSAVHRYVARAHFGTWLARTGRPDFARLTGVFTPLVHVDFGVTDVPLEPSTRLRVAGRSRLARVLGRDGALRHIAREGSWTIRTSDGREVGRARLVNVFTRYDVDPARRRVTELPPELGLGLLPSNTIEVPTLDDLVPPGRAAEAREEEPRVWHYGETDPNRHVNGMAYLRALEDYLAAPMIADPLRKFDICQVSDSAGAIVLVRAERARDLARPPVLVQGFAEQYIQHATPFGTDDWIDNGVLAGTGRLAMDRAGLCHSDIDLVQIYDAFTINVLIGLEELGFCGRGESGAFVQGGRIAPGGAFPMNTSGGGLSFNHGGMFGMPLMIESVRQLRGECGERQVPGVRNCLMQAGGLVMSAYMVMILGLGD